ncbi:MAG: ABC transporter permease [Treponema sp.]|jgi:peptide/nickel transport system permease protein|nr:ABC transporter permease [Treponema sp.]
MAGNHISYILRRLVSALFTLWVALTINFLIPRVMGGDPAEYIASTTAMGSQEYADILRERFGLDKGIAEQYIRYLGQLLKGDMGISFSTYPVPVADIITRAMPWTLLIVLSSILISFAVAWVLGVLAALKKGSLFDQAMVGVSYYLQSTPYFYISMILIMSLAYHLGVFPLAHAMPTGLPYDTPWYMLVGPVIYHAFLPVFSLIIVSLAGRMVMMRSNILQIFSEDYITLAQAKGLRRGTILTKYALRNALLPSFTSLMLNLGNAVGGAITTEMIFSYPGIGYTIMNAIHAQDYPLIQGCFAIIAVSVVVMNLLADLIYPLLDPRVALS